MAKKKFEFDFKKFLLEKGERVGLAVAGGIAALLIILGVMVGLGKTSPLGELQKNTQDLLNKVERANPGDLPGTPEKPDFEGDINPDTFSIVEWMARHNAEDNKRRNPSVLGLVGTKVQVLQAPLQIMDYSEKKQELQWMDPAGKPAEKIRPVHMVIVTGAYPYQEQLKNFQRALRIKKLADLKGDDWPNFAGFVVMRRDTGPDGTVRKVRDTSDKEVEWEILDLDSEKGKFRQLLQVTSEPPTMTEEANKVAVPGLGMPLLQLAMGTEYKDVEGLQGLPIIKVVKKEDPSKAGPMPPTGGAAGNKLVGRDLKELESTPDLHDRLTGDSVDVFEPLKGLGKAKKDDKDAKDAKPAIGVENMPLENCLFRFIDVEVEPGHTYDYQIYIHMNNPNSKKYKLVAARHYADVEFLKTPDNSPNLVLNVHIPFDMEYFVVDEHALDEKNYKGNAVMTGADKEKAKQGGLVPLYLATAAVQIHRWVDYVESQGGVNRSGLGRWLIAERLLVRRGDPIGREVPVDAPKWDEAEGAFFLTIAGPAARPKKIIARPAGKGGVEVNFSTRPAPQLEPVMVLDFEGGRQSVQLAANNTKFDASAVEMLVLSPEGKLQVHNGRKDSADQNRKERYVAWRNWIFELKGYKKGAKDPGLFD